jgi:hypothetical protein
MFELCGISGDNKGAKNPRNTETRVLGPAGESPSTPGLVKIQIIIRPVIYINDINADVPHFFIVAKLL